jgi:predicted RecA/RadA family phage recombinase
MSAGRGGLLIGAAVVVGLLIFTVISRGPSSSGTSSTTVPSTVLTVPATNPDGTPVTTIATTETTKAKQTSKTARSNDQVVVQVLNASGVQGAATGRTNDLKAKGYQALPANNAAQTRTGTVVQCKPGYEKEAEALATTLGELGSPATVDALPDPLPSEYDAGANCYVVLGS